MRQVLNLTNQLPGASDLIGTLTGTRALEVITAYVVAFFNSVLKSEPSPLLRAPSQEFPEVVYVATGNSDDLLKY